MPTTIGKDAGLDLRNLTVKDSTTARKLLREISTQINGKSGTLNLVLRGGQWQIRRQNWFFRLFNQFSLEPEQTKKFLSNLLRQAATDRVEGDSEAGEIVEEKDPLHFNRAVVPHLCQFLQPKKEVDAGELHGKLSDLFAARREDLGLGDSTKPTTFQQFAGRYHLDAEPNETLSKFTTRKSQTRGILKGGLGILLKIGEDPFGQPRMLKLEKQQQPLEKNAHRGPELSATYLFSHKTGKGIPGVCIPTHFLFQDKRGNIFEVPAQRIKSFLKAKAGLKLSYVGQILPEVKGQNLQHIQNSGEPLNPVEKREISKQMLGILRSLASRGFAHKDIKPANFMWDRANQQLTLVDTGSVEKLGKKSADSTRLTGTLKYIHPKVYSLEKHSYPVDGMSAGLTLLDLHLPESGLRDAWLHLPDASRVKARNKIDTGDYLRNWLGTDDFQKMEDKSSLHDFLNNIGTGEPLPTYEDFCHCLIQASFLEPEDYKNALRELENHPYLKS